MNVGVNLLYSIWLPPTGHEKRPLVSKDLHSTRIWPRAHRQRPSLPISSFCFDFPAPPPFLSSSLCLLLSWVSTALLESLRLRTPFTWIPAPSPAHGTSHVRRWPFSCFTSPPFKNRWLRGATHTSSSPRIPAFLFFWAVALPFQVQVWLLTLPTLVSFSHPSNPLAGCKQLLLAFF